MRIDTHIVEGLDEYMKCVGKLAGDGGKPPVLWFRGLSDVNHSLVPSLLRQKTRVARNGLQGDYSALHYAEDIRTQHYIAKNYHFFSKEPSSRVEWLEVMQHHGMNTRVLDWSESSVHSLIFSLEPFLNENRYSMQTRAECVPCVWVLEPGKINKEIFGFLKQQILLKTDFVGRLIDELEINRQEREQIFISMEKFGKTQINETKETGHIDYILNLNAINDEILRDRCRMKYLLKSGDVINPFYYLLGRIYSDGHILKERILPPLAVVHPYHSERIKAQKGVFAVFPFYEEDAKKDGLMRSMGINPDAMENNNMAEKYLHKIIISRPQKVAHELLSNGMNDSWLYPEMPIVSSEIENREVYS